MPGRANSAPPAASGHEAAEPWQLRRSASVQPILPADPRPDRREVEAMNRWLDLSFALAGDRVPRAYAPDLYRALQAAAPWLDEEPLAGVHPLRGLTPCAHEYLLGGRARLTLRVPPARRTAGERLQGCELDLPDRLRLGRASVRELLAHPVLYAHRVVTEADDEQAFVAIVARAVDDLGLDCEAIVGRRVDLRFAGRTWTGFSLMLHGLSAEDSLKAQAQGIGLHRKLGCGLFVPHKSVAAVGH